MKKFLLLALLLSPSLAFANKGRDVTYEVGGEKYEGFYISAGKRAPLVVLIHDWDGLTEYEKSRADMLRKRGYSVFAADLYGKGVRPTEVGDRIQHMTELEGDREKMRRLVLAALAEADAQGANTGNAAIIGYCFGGSVALELARSGADLKGFVSIHGGLTTPENQNYSETRGRILVQHGGADTSVSLEDFITLADQLEQAGADHEMIIYGGAPHAWTVFGQELYRSAPDKTSWLRLVDFLEKLLK